MKAQDSDTSGELIQSRIRVVQGVDFDKYRLEGFAVSDIGALGDNKGSYNNIKITAQGGLDVPIVLNDSELWRTCFMSKYVRYNGLLGVTKTALEDVGVYVAGQGDQKSKDTLKTADGFVYAIPMFKVSRRNSGGYSVNNPNGGFCINTRLMRIYIFRKW